MSRHATYVFSGGARDLSSGRPQGEIVTPGAVARSEMDDMTAIILIVTVVFFIFIKCFQGDIVTVDPLTIPRN